MPNKNSPAPHTCGDCGEPAYHGFNMPGKCVQFGCAFYDEPLWVEWCQSLPDDGMPRNDEPDFFDDEDTIPKFTFTFTSFPVDLSLLFSDLVDPEPEKSTRGGPGE